jgi:hypothetical protein
MVLPLYIYKCMESPIEILITRSHMSELSIINSIKQICGVKVLDDYRSMYLSIYPSSNYLIEILFYFITYIRPFISSIRPFISSYMATNQQDD